jgi:hypothetical protein
MVIDLSVGRRWQGLAPSVGISPLPLRQAGAGVARISVSSSKHLVARPKTGADMKR